MKKLRSQYMKLTADTPLGNKKHLFLCFFLPALVLWLIYIAMKVWPFGDNSVLVLDLNAQYVYYFAELREKILEGGSLLYSWNRSLGGEFMGMFAYYLASPFSFIVALFPLKNITEALLVIMLLKAGLCGLTMGIFLSHIRPSAKRSVVIFSVMYALSSYAIVQCHNTMWIDALIYLPLIMLGVEKLITERKYILYTVTLALAVMANYYIGYMICIFTFLYFFYSFFSKEEGYERDIYNEKNHFIKSLLRIFVFSVIALGIAMIILYPAYYSLTFGKTEFSDPNLAITQKFDFLDFLAKMLPASYDTVRPAGLPFVYCGVLTLLLIPSYFASKKIAKREKIASVLLTAIMIFCMNTSVVDIFWHGMQKPNWLNYRYSFMFCFLLITFAFKAFSDLDALSFKTVGLTGGLIAGFAFILQKLDLEYIQDMKTVWFTALALIIYLTFIWVAKNKYLRQSAIIMMTLIVAGEMFLSGYLELVALDDDVVYSGKSKYEAFLDRFVPEVEAIKEKETQPFYRMEKEFHRKTNDAMALDMNGISSSTSTLNASVITLLNRMGYASKSHWSKYLGGTPVSDSLLGIKYIMYGSDPDKTVYQPISKNDEDLVYSYINPYALSIGYCSTDGLHGINVEESISPFIFMNELVSEISGKDTVIFKEIPTSDPERVNLDSTYTSKHLKYTPINSAKTSKLTFIVTVPANEEVYVYFPSDYNREAQLTSDGISMGTVFGNDTDRIIYLGVFDTSRDISVSLTLDDDNLYLRSGVPYFFSLDESALDVAMTDIASAQLDVTEFDDTKVKGNITVPNDRTVMLTTIPYDEGWVLTVDGIETPIIKSLDSLLSAELEAGEHEIMLEYKPSCVTVGGIVSISSIAVFVAYAVISTVLKNKKLKKLSEAIVK